MVRVQPNEFVCEFAEIGQFIYTIRLVFNSFESSPIYLH